MARLWDVRKDARRAPILETLAAAVADLDRRPIPWRELEALAGALRHKAETPTADDWQAGRAAGLLEAVEAITELLARHK